MPLRYLSGSSMGEALASVTIRNYPSGLRRFFVWCESIWKKDERSKIPSHPGQEHKVFIRLRSRNECID